VLFESSDGVFSGVAAMEVMRHQLVLYIIVVESLEFWFEALDSEFLMDGIIGLGPF
jgi:hypothetical protein